MSTNSTPLRPLNTIDLEPAQYARNVWRIEAPEGSKPEELLASLFWRNVSKNLRQRDKIEAQPVDDSWYAEYIVMEVDESKVRVRLITQVSLLPPEVDLSAPIEIPKDYKVEFNPKLRWCVIRNNGTNKDRIFSNGSDKLAAEAWLKDHIRNIAA